MQEFTARVCTRVTERFDGIDLRGGVQDLGFVNFQWFKENEINTPYKSADCLLSNTFYLIRIGYSVHEI